MRRAAHVDANHVAVVAALRAIGATVQSLATAGQGVPDLLVGHLGVNHLLEVKDGAKTASRQQLTEAQETWHSSWRGQVAVVTSPEEAVRLVLGRGFVPGTLMHEASQRANAPVQSIAEPLAKLHDWSSRGPLSYCLKCGVVKRADGQQKPCRGPVKVGLR